MNERHIIDSVYEREEIIKWIKNYFITNGNENTKAVIGISGGKDSTIAAALLVRALGADRVIGVLMPQGIQKDISDSHCICEALGIKTYEVNIEAACNAFYDSFCNSMDGTLNSQILTNVPARARMITLYMVAAAVGGRVCNTGNASELYVGYTTKYGDLAGDFALFKNYFVRDVLAIGASMPEIPSYLIYKKPGDGMCGENDEDNLGFSYETLDALCLDNCVPDYDIFRKIETRHKNNVHKKAIDLPAPRPRSRHKDGEEWHPEEEWYF